MRSNRDQLLAANTAYANGRAHRQLPAPPARRLAILTCMDARMDPAAFLGLRLGDAHVIRNAGGRASDDAIRSLVISHKLLGTAEWLVIHHTDCGQEKYTDDAMRQLCAWRPEAAAMDWLTITDREQAVVDDVRRLRLHPLVPPEVTIHGYVFDVDTGRLAEVEAASRIGQAGPEGEEGPETEQDGNDATASPSAPA